MPRPIKMRVGDESLEVLEQQFEIERESWNEYKLLDGGTVRVKTSIHRIFRVLDADGRPAYNDQGDPYMVIRHKTDVVAAE